MLTPKQQRFVDEYSIDRNASRAARAAGYSAVSAKVTASRMLTRANVQAALTVREKEAQRALAVTRETVIRELQEAIEIARAQGNPTAMIAGWREIAKICGFYAPEQRKVEMSVTDAGEIRRLERMSDAELLHLVNSNSPTNIEQT